MSNQKESPVKARELTITRLFNASRKLVWKAWTDPEHFKKWWGPKDYSSPACKLDFRVGGKYLFCMVSPEGKEYWNGGKYIEIIPQEKLVYTDAFADADGNWVSAAEMGMPGEGWPDEFLVTITFEEVDGKTLMTLKHTGVPEGIMEEMTSAGWNQSFDKLEATLN